MARKQVNFLAKAKAQSKNLDVEDWVQTRGESSKNDADPASQAKQVSSQAKQKENSKSQPEQVSSQIDQKEDSKSQSKQPSVNPPEKMKRLTLDIPYKLHREIKIQAVAQGITMADMLRALLEKHYK